MNITPGIYTRVNKCVSKVPYHYANAAENSFFSNLKRHKKLKLQHKKVRNSFDLFYKESVNA